ncbi:hypothetical protein FO519_004999 [Halicephalobus sp. NKZ332]|nr:hypothetical protein FO519_004999 [Halicephalobus sp. NKZ332]
MGEEGICVFCKEVRKLEYKKKEWRILCPFEVTSFGYGKLISKDLDPFPFEYGKMIEDDIEFSPGYGKMIEDDSSHFHGYCKIAKDDLNPFSGYDKLIKDNLYLSSEYDVNLNDMDSPPGYHKFIKGNLNIFSEYSKAASKDVDSPSLGHCKKSFSDLNSASLADWIIRAKLELHLMHVLTSDLDSAFVCFTVIDEGLELARKKLMMHFFFEDGGEIVCVAVNDFEIVFDSGILEIEEEDIAGEEPYFIEPLGMARVRCGMTVQLRCRVSGYPQPYVTFFKDNQIINDTEGKYFIEYIDDTWNLKIGDFDEEDEGLYTAVATNRISKVPSRFRIAVISNPSSPKSLSTDSNVLSTDEI